MAVYQDHHSRLNQDDDVQARPLKSFLEAIADRRAVPGVLSFSATGEVLFMNPEAEVLSRQIIGSRNGNASGDRFPSEVLDLCDDLQASLQKPMTAEDCEQLELRRVTGNLQLPVLLRGFVLPDRHQATDTRLLILMEKIGRESQVIPTQTKERFHLTDREEEIVEHIADGLTNKEIAKALSISEHTVKEHVRHLLKKTKSSTRTGILAQIYQDS